MNRCQAAIVAVLAIGLSLFPLVMARAANLPGSLSVTPFAGGYFFEGNQQRENMPIYGLSLGYNFSDHWAFELTGSVVPDSTAITDPASGILSPQKWNIYGARGDILLHLLPDKRFVPYLAAGGGGLFLNPRQGDLALETMVDYGGGFKFFLNDYLALRIDVRHIFDLVDKDLVKNRDMFNNLACTAGLTFQMGGSGHPVRVVQEEESAQKAVPATPVPELKEPPVASPPPENVAPPAAAEPSPVPVAVPKAAEAATQPPPPEAEHPVAPAPPVAGDAVKKPVVKEIAVVPDGLEIRLEGEVGQFKEFALAKQPRLVIDIMGAENGLGYKMIPINQHGIAVARIGQHPGFLRVVLDVATAQVPWYLVTRSGKGLKVELKQKNGD
jgi:outer membrane beta-barrel protein